MTRRFRYQFRPRPIHPKVLFPYRQLLEAQIAAELTDEMLAEAVGYSASTLNRLRTGSIELRLRTLTDFAQYFNLEVRLVPKEPKV